MGSWRFVLSRRWVLFAVIVVILAYACWWLGGWQFGRLHDRKADNTVIRTNENRSPAPVGEVVPVGGEVSHSQEWRIVTATGRYDPSQTVVVRYQTNDEGAAGVDIVVPLITADGTVVLVDRGWVGTDPSGADRGDAPDPPSGEVTVTGYVRENGTGSSTSVDDHSTRAISSTTIGRAIGMPVYAGFVDLRSESPKPATPLEAVDLPELDNGPHFFYGLQWWFFGVLGVFGFFYLMYDERRNGPRGEREQGRVAAPATAATQPARPVRPAPARASKAKKVRQSNHPYVRARQEAAARAQAGVASGDQDLGRDHGEDLGQDPGKDLVDAHSARSIAPSTGIDVPDTNDAAGDSTKAATRPNSTGSA